MASAKERANPFQSAAEALRDAARRQGARGGDDGEPIAVFAALLEEVGRTTSETPAVEEADAHDTVDVAVEAQDGLFTELTPYGAPGANPLASQDFFSPLKIRKKD